MGKVRKATIRKNKRSIYQHEGTPLDVNKYPVFQGVLEYQKMGGLAKVAYRSWLDQLARCTNPNRKDYKWYGAKGVQVTYGSRDFISWFLIEAQNTDRPTVDRLDTSKNYDFSNIQVLSLSENVIKANKNRKKIRPIS